MSWLEKLYQTYNNCLEHIGEPSAKTRLLPICHTTQNAQIEIIIDGMGAFKRANVIPKKESATDIPCTEESGGRTGSKPVCHPLCDKLQYVAGDFTEFGGEVTLGFAKAPDQPYEMYIEQLSKWCASPYKHPKVEAIYKYVQKKSVISDLYSVNILPKDALMGKILKEWTASNIELPEIFRVMPNKDTPPENSFIRWVVEIPNDSQPPEVWLDKNVWESWSSYDISMKSSLGLCYVTGEKVHIAEKHPAKLRHAGDGAKLISSNDDRGFTFRGRFTDTTGHQAAGVGFEVTQKAHNALRWLIGRQGNSNGKQVIVAWSVGGKSIPDPLASSWDLLLEGDDESNKDKSVGTSLNVNAAQDFALRLKNKINGYHTELGDASSIIILGVNSATIKGRMSIIYFRELVASDFLFRIESWHKECCWEQNYGKFRFVGAPSPKDIAEVACGLMASKELCNATIREIIPCIIDSKPLPRHLIERVIRRASNRNGIKRSDWEKSLGIACALYCKHTKNKRNFKMSLETNRTARDYLYGRLLALAERLEEVALGLANEKRETNAGRLLQRFADNPYQTWAIIEKALKPYEIRLRKSHGGFLHNIKMEIDTVMSAFNRDDFKSPAKLEGEFLLGYHCQRSALRFNKNKADAQVVTENINEYKKEEK